MLQNRLAFIYTLAMVRLHRKIEYALMALRVLSGTKESYSAKILAERMAAPPEAVAKILQILARAGLVRSSQGVSGGYVLSTDLSKVSFIEIYELFSGPVSIVKCLESGPSACESHGHCNIMDPMQIFNAKVRQFYSDLTVRELLEPNLGKSKSLHAQKSVSRLPASAPSKSTSRTSAPRTSAPKRLLDFKSKNLD